jgi:hypothetical protein
MSTNTTINVTANGFDPRQLVTVNVGDTISFETSGSAAPRDVSIVVNGRQDTTLFLDGLTTYTVPGRYLVAPGAVSGTYEITAGDLSTQVAVNVEVRNITDDTTGPNPPVIQPR